jgi:Tol biopolymer transport system component
MAADGSGRARLVRNPPGGGYPIWSPDGTRIAFVNYVPDFGGLYVVNADGSGLKRLTRGRPAEPGGFWSPPWSPPGWSPDGKKILFTRALGRRLSPMEPQEVWVIGDDGTAARKLASNPVGWAQPVWSPDGHKFAFIGNRVSGNYIFLMNADGSDQRQLTYGKGGGSDMCPAWSPDGRWLAFMRDGIWLIHPDGTDQHRLAGSAADDWFPTWSPDSKKLAVTGHGEPVGTPHQWSDLGGDDEIYVIGVTNGRRLRLTANADNDLHPAWSPDGRWIAFTSERDGPPRIYKVRPDGSDPTDLSGETKSTEEWCPAWAPAVKRPR